MAVILYGADEKPPDAAFRQTAAHVLYCNIYTFLLQFILYNRIPDKTMLKLKTFCYE